MQGRAQERASEIRGDTRRGLKCSISKDNITEEIDGCCFVSETSSQEIILISREKAVEKLRGSCEKKEGAGVWKKTWSCVGARIKKKRWKITTLPNHYYACSDPEKNASSKREAGCTLTIISSLVLFYINVRVDSCSTITTSVFAIIGTINYVGNLFALLLE